MEPEGHYSVHKSWSLDHVISRKNPVNSVTYILILDFILRKSDKQTRHFGFPD
jgi:hypothetical protein